MNRHRMWMSTKGSPIKTTCPYFVLPYVFGRSYSDLFPSESFFSARFIDISASLLFGSAFDFFYRLVNDSSVPLGFLLDQARWTTMRAPSSRTHDSVTRTHWAKDEPCHEEIESGMRFGLVKIVDSLRFERVMGTRSKNRRRAATPHVLYGNRNTRC